MGISTRKVLWTYRASKHTRLLQPRGRCCSNIIRENKRVCGKIKWVGRFSAEHPETLVSTCLHSSKGIIPAYGPTTPWATFWSTLRPPPRPACTKQIGQSNSHLYTTSSVHKLWNQTPYNMIAELNMPMPWMRQGNLCCRNVQLATNERHQYKSTVHNYSPIRSSPTLEPKSRTRIKAHEIISETCITRFPWREIRNWRWNIKHKLLSRGSVI